MFPIFLVVLDVMVLTKKVDFTRMYTFFVPLCTSLLFFWESAYLTRNVLRYVEILVWMSFNVGVTRGEA